MDPTHTRTPNKRQSVSCTRSSHVFRTSTDSLLRATSNKSDWFCAPAWFLAVLFVWFLKLVKVRHGGSTYNPTCALCSASPLESSSSMFPGKPRSAGLSLQRPVHWLYGINPQLCALIESLRTGLSQHSSHNNRLYVPGNMLIQSERWVCTTR